ncbi:cornulin [Peromyscus maniculatus bairdii]|uniref:cornulin n=1 Tax=Peromyscus maniculatus bairdii TaxID=230844 RepID=UPI00042AC526|nr:cornulin [Peromyscus maniculatus bairdii]
MPQLLQNIHGIIEAFGCYARSEGGCKVLTRGELKRLLEHEFADVIVNPHDPSTVDEILRLLDEDNTGTVEFKEFLVLVFKVARACFKTLSEIPRGADKSEGCYPGSSKELAQGQIGGPGVGRDAAEQCREDSSWGQRDRASKEQVRVGTHTQSQESYPTQVSSHNREVESQRQKRVSQQTQVTGQVEQTLRTEDKSWSRERRSERQSQTSQHTEETTAGAFQTQGSACGQNRGTNSHSQDRSQAGQAATQHDQTQAGSHTQTHTQREEEGWRQQTGSGSIQTQESIYDQNRETETHSQDRNQAGQAAKEQHQAQAEPYTQTHTQTVERGRSQQAGNSSIQTHGAIYDQNRRTEIHGQDSSRAGQVGTGHFQTQVGSYSQTLEHDRSQAAGQIGAPEKRQTQIPSGMGQGWTPVSNCETGEPGLGGQVQTQTSTVEERQDCSSNHPSPKGGQRESVPTVIRDEWVNDHTREIVIQSQNPGSPHPRVPSAQGQDTAQMEEKKGITAKGLYSYLKTDRP